MAQRVRYRHVPSATAQLILSSYPIRRGFATLVSAAAPTRRVPALTSRSPPQMGEVIALNEIQPSWNVHASFLKYHRTAALELDSLRSSHPVQMASADDSEDAVTQSLYDLRLVDAWHRS